jgi:hypothetical protein
MIHREDLIPHFEWLAGSRYYDDALDEALVAIAFVARGCGAELVEYGAAWMMASGVVEVFGLEGLAEKAQNELPLFAKRMSPEELDKHVGCLPTDGEG